MYRLGQGRGRLVFDMGLSGFKGRGEALLIKMEPRAKINEVGQACTISLWQRRSEASRDDITVAKISKSL